MSSLLNSLEQSSQKILKTLKRFPLVALSAYLMTTILVALTAVKYGSMDHYPHYPLANKIAFVASLGIPLFLVLRLISKNWILSLLGLISLGFYYEILPDQFERNSMIMERHFLLIVALGLLTLVAPFLFRSINNRDFWEWVEQALFALLSALLFGSILYLGISGGIYAFGKLFDITIHARLYGQIALVVFGVFGVLYFLSQLPPYPRLVKSQPYSKVERIFTQFILTPLALLYFVILYAYTFKILLFAQFPSGIMAWLILVFSSVAIVTLLFWTPLWHANNQHYRRWAWLAILLQIPVLALSIYLRIEQYGITEHRYYIVLMGGWLLVISLLFLLLRRASYKWIFLLLSLLIIASQVGTYSAYAIAKQSQTKQLQKLLNERNTTQESNRSLSYQISSKLHYLYEQHGIESLQSTIPAIIEAYQKSEENLSQTHSEYHYFPRYAAQQLGIEYINAWNWQYAQDSKDHTLLIRSDQHLDLSRGIDVEGYEWIQSFYYQEGYRMREAPQGFTLHIDKERIRITQKSKPRITLDLHDFITQLYQSTESQESLRPIKAMTYQYENRQVAIKIIFDSIGFSSKHKIVHYGGTLFIHQK